MSTQGLVVIMRHGLTVAKIVAGSDGYRALVVADRIAKENPKTLRELYDIARFEGFGSQDDLVVIGRGNAVVTEADFDPEQSPLYFSTFQCLWFNPRWAHGTAQYVYGVETYKTPGTIARWNSQWYVIGPSDDDEIEQACWKAYQKRK